jgi:hypothetical protein
VAHYVKTFDRIFQSTIWQEDSDTRIVWWTLLLLADQDGKAHSTIPGLAHTARVTLESCVRALERFKSPDKYSSTKDFDGRRIGDADGGWQILNFEKYRDMMSEDDRREKDRLRQQRKRERDRLSKTVTPCHALSQDVRDVTENPQSHDTRLDDTRLKEGGAKTPPDLHSLEYAKRLLEEIDFPVTRQNNTVVADCITALVKSGKSKASAYEFLLANAKDAIDAGEQVDKFWFEDAKWKKKKKAVVKLVNPADEARRQLAEQNAD